MDKRREVLVGGGVLLLIALATAVAWFGVLDEDTPNARPGMREGDPASDAADEFADAWETGQLAEIPVTPASGVVQDRTQVITTNLGAQLESIVVTGLEEVPPAQEGGPERRAATLRVSWAFGPERTWAYDTTLPLVESAAGEGEPLWLVDWAPSVVHPRLLGDDRLSVVRLPAARGEILGLDGEALVGLRPVVQIGIQPGATTGRTGTAQQVAGLVGVDSAALVERVEAAGDTDLVSVVTLRQEAFADVETALRAIPGVVLDETELPLAPTRNWARALIGSVGPATTELVAASDGRLSLGEYTGLSGLQAAQDVALAGQAGLSIRVDTAEGRDPFVLQEFDAVPGTSITITLDPAIQAAADDALAVAPGPAALVAIRVSTGDVLAVANGPSGADGYNRAMVGSYAPGSTFKVASTFGLLQQGLTPETVVSCPATIVAGKEFKNAGGFALGDVPFRTDFARSCNTAFVGQADDITADELTEAAADLGFRPLDIGMPLVEGTVPPTDSATEHAADMIGQGKVQTSPFVVALMSASVAAGRSVEPRLVVDPEAPEPVPGAALPEAVIADLRELMRAVVTEGTGSAVADVPGGEVSGKSGTAEYGDEDPPLTHAWFTGFQGDIAFAVLVEGGSSGGGVAAPLAAEFLTTLAEGVPAG